MNEQQEQAVGQSMRRHPLSQRTYGSLIDQQIAQAEAAGQFANLPGQGQRINLNDDANVPNEDRMGYRMLQSAGFSLPWVEARHDIDEERGRIAAWLIHANNRWPYLQAPSQAALKAEYRAKLAALRGMIIDYNLRVPPSVGQMRGIEIGKELAKLGA